MSQGHTGYVSSLVIVADKLFSGSWDASVIIWDRKTLKKIDTLSIEHKGNIYAVLQYKSLLYTASQDKTIRCWSATSNNYKDTLGEVHSQKHPTKAHLSMPPSLTSVRSRVLLNTDWRWSTYGLGDVFDGGGDAEWRALVLWLSRQIPARVGPAKARDCGTAESYRERSRRNHHVYAANAQQISAHSRQYGEYIDLAHGNIRVGGQRQRCVRCARVCAVPA